jgi:hypothetical protein
MNTISIVLTTYVGYWLVSSYLQYQYSASQHIHTYSANFLPGYIFHNTGWSQQNFIAELPGEIASAQLTITGNEYGQGLLRYVNVYIDGTEVNSSRELGSFSYTFDVSSNLFFKRTTTVGIVVTTYDTSSSSGEYWAVSASIQVVTRFANLPDTDDGYWAYDSHPVMQNSGVIYLNSETSSEMNLLLAGFSGETKTIEYTQGERDQQTPLFYTGVTVFMNPSAVNDFNYPGTTTTNEGFAANVRSDVSISLNGQNIPQGSFEYVQGYQTPPSGSDNCGNIGSDLFNVISILAADYPEVSIPAGIGAILMNYMSQSNQQQFQSWADSNGVHLSDTVTTTPQQKSDALYYETNFQLLGTGIYTISVTTTISIIWVYLLEGEPLAQSLTSASFTTQVSYYYGP